MPGSPRGGGSVDARYRLGSADRNPILNREPRLAARVMREVWGMARQDTAALALGAIVGLAVTFAATAGMAERRHTRTRRRSHR